MKVVFIIFCCSVLQVTAQHPQRKALLGMRGGAVSGGVKIDSIVAGATMARLGLHKGDLVTSLNQQALSSLARFNELTNNLRAGDTISVTYVRNNHERSVKGTAVMRPFESSLEVDILYDWVAFRNGFLRTITRKPKGSGTFPAILYIPGYGCGSIENYTSTYNGKLINEWVKGGYAVITIEKSGVGDSHGCVPCSEADLATDIESFDEGYKFMEQLPFAEKSKLFIWGHSMGGVIAPEIARRHQPKGVMVFGTTFRPWSEFLLEMHRVQKPLLEKRSYVQTEDFIRQIQQVYYEFFVLKKTREDLYNNKAYTQLVVSDMGYKKGSNDMWGRHWIFGQQIDSLNLAKSWQNLSCPVLVVHGETDYEACSIVEPRLIAQTVNEAHPGNATMLIIPALDHFMMTSASYEIARDNFKSQQYLKGNFNHGIATATLQWLKQHSLE